MPFVSGFLPSQNAPLFHNGPWPPGTSLTVSIPGLPTISIDVTQMGMCGGMSFLTRDIFEAGTPQLRNTDSAKIPIALAELIVGRLVQSFDGPETVARWVSLTGLPDHDTTVWGAGVFHQTVNECQNIMADINMPPNGTLSPIGVIRTGPSWWPGDVFNNHVELVYGFDLVGSQLTLHVYDCNNPGNDSITISLDISSTTPAKPITTNGTDDPSTPGQIRGFFRLPYTHADPTPAYIDDAAVYARWDPGQMATGSSDTATVVAVNMGSTTWTQAAFYRLGSQAPQDNTIWGTARADLPVASVDPQEPVLFSFPVTAPTSQGQFAFSWQMVRDPEKFFGSVLSPPETITVAAPDAIVVPDVVGLNAAGPEGAKQTILDAGLKYIAHLLGGGPDPGTVAFQRPLGGTITTPGATVAVWVEG
jgi:hypothetical protein